MIRLLAVVTTNTPIIYILSNIDTTTQKSPVPVAKLTPTAFMIVLTMLRIVSPVQRAPPPLQTQQSATVLLTGT